MFWKGQFVKVIDSKDFLTQVYSTGVKSYSEFELSCLLRVMGMQDLESSIAYYELELILGAFGVKKKTLGFDSNYEDNDSPVNSKNADFS